MNQIEFEVRKRLALLIDRKRYQEHKRDYRRRMSYAMTGYLVHSRAPDPRKWWNTPEARDSDGHALMFKLRCESMRAFHK